ncbi:MAG: DUF4469 domain-containing protein [Phycisphaerae bacterium]|nr:DUF4469 domain-containing protein [Phycisphaerae bacterium]
MIDLREGPDVEDELQALKARIEKLSLEEKRALLEWLSRKVEAVKPSPNPIEYRDIGTDTTNDTVTVGNIGQLSGSRLKFDPAEADEGLYFVADAGGETKVPTVQKNKPSQLVFLVPNLVAGTYHLEVRARMGSGTSARELRIGRLDSTLTVLPT